ncbi:hypothetical protein ZCP4_1027 [Zymomonas mobilis subsp. mobilis str. CP4 = NRRL B-14023]|nr:hypothetical protein ZCP4_1027 [Zymomonas mobilis subsp. mobilis str. CP4 = NRRL B-14023]
MVTTKTPQFFIRLGFTNLFLSNFYKLLNIKIKTAFTKKPFLFEDYLKIKEKSFFKAFILIYCFFFG